MEQSFLQNHGLSTDSRPARLWRIGSLVAGSSAALLAVATFTTHHTEFGRGLLAIAIGVFCFVAIVHGRFLYLARQRLRQTTDFLQMREVEFQSVFENAMDAILIVDGQTICREANPAAFRLLGFRREQLIGQSIRACYSDQREFNRSWGKLLEAVDDRGEVALARAEDVVFAEFTARANFLPDRHLIVFRDITQRRQAEDAKAQSLTLAKAAWQEADALRRATLALTEDLRLDYVLDTLLRTLYSLVPYGAAQVLLCETETRLFLAREVFSPDPDGRLWQWPKTLATSEYPLLAKALQNQDGILVSDTGGEDRWTPIFNGAQVRSWIGVPLISSSQVLGLLSLSHAEAEYFSQEHLRRAASLSISAAAAIQNARIYERAEIYGAELERRLTDLHQAQAALQNSEESRNASEERFQRLFRSTPVPFSVTALKDGRFIDVNEAFERRYGYSRDELIGRTSAELDFWEDTQERMQLVEELRSGLRVRGRVSRFRLKSGEWRISVYSAETIPLDGQICLLLVSDDLPSSDQKHYRIRTDKSKNRIPEQ